MTKALAALGLIGALVAPAASFAATYQYVDASGIVRSVEANNEMSALSMATNIALHSGVAIENAFDGLTNGEFVPL